MGAWRLVSTDGDDKVNGEIDDRAAVDRFQDRRSVQLAGAGHRSRSDRLHQPASRADAVLQRAAAGTLQRPHPVDLEGAGDQRLWLDRRRPGLSDHGVEQPRGFRRRLQHAHGRQHRASVSDRLSRRDHRPQCARLLAADASAISGSSATRSRSRAGSTIAPPLIPGLAGSTSAYFTPNIDAARRLCRRRHAARPFKPDDVRQPNSATGYRTRDWNCAARACS